MGNLRLATLAKAWPKVSESVSSPARQLLHPVKNILTICTLYDRPSILIRWRRAFLLK